MDSSAIHGCAVNFDGLDNPIFTDQFDFMDCFDEEIAAILGEGFDGCLSPENNSTSSSSSTIPVSSFPASSTPIVLSFGNAPQRPPSPCEAAVTLSRPQSDPGDPPKRAANMKRTSRVRPPSQTYDHIIAERKRREQLSQHFLALSTIVPGLKKMDKTSVLGDAITYLKDLQGRVKTLEEEASKKSMESVVLVKKSRITYEDEDGDGDEQKEQWLPEIEARVCDTQILIRIQCEKRKGLLTQLIGLVENLNLSIVNTSATAFGVVALEITIITKMEKEFNLTVNEVLKRLHGAIKNAS